MTVSGKALRWIASIVAGATIVFIFVYALATVVANYKRADVLDAWANSFGTLEQIRERFPTREANAAALEVEVLSVAVGIDLVPRWSARARPQQRPTADDRRIRMEIGDYFRRQIERDETRIDPPPAVLAGMLSAKGESLDALVDLLLGPEAPRWEIRLDRLAEAPIPNLRGHASLQNLMLTDAIVLVWRGDHERALRRLEASWRLNTALCSDPSMISQLTAMSVARMQLGVLRHIDADLRGWPERLYEHDFFHAILVSLQLEGWYWAGFGDAGTMYGGSGVLGRLVMGIGKPYVRYSVADLSELWLEELQRLSRLDYLCDRDLAGLNADLYLEPSGWNYPAQIVAPGFVGLTERLARWEVDREMTAKLLRARLARAANDGVWPTAVAEIETSDACPDDRWIYEVGPAGGMRLALSREIEWGLDRGADLPVRFVSSP